MKYLIPLMLLSTTAMAQKQQNGPCDQAQRVYNLLIQNYGERPFIEMVDNKGHKLIMFVNPETSTWTIVATDDSIACGISAGKDFTPADPKRFQEKKKENPS